MKDSAVHETVYQTVRFLYMFIIFSFCSFCFIVFHFQIQTALLDAGGFTNGVKFNFNMNCLYGMENSNMAS